YEGRDIRGSRKVEFVTTGSSKGPAARAASGVPWPMYGRDAARLRVLAGVRVRPPYMQIWASGGRALLEFPPSIGYGRLYVADGDGVVTAYRARSGNALWQFRSRRCVAATPAVANGLVYETFLNQPPCNAVGVSDGEVVALDARRGALVWRRKI